MRSVYVLVTMSATRPHLDKTIQHCRPEDTTPVCLDTEDLESTAPEYLRDLKYELAREGYVPSRVQTTARFDEDCSIETQHEAEDLRSVVRAASFLGAGTVTVNVVECENDEKVRPALEALEERARREGVSLHLEGEITLAS